MSRTVFGSPVCLRIRCLASLMALFFISGVLVRLCLLLSFRDDFQAALWNLPRALASGALNDLGTYSFLALPAVLLVMLPPKDFFAKRRGRILVAALFFTCCGVLIFTGCAEYLFWDEFHSRFNFIAVDYLIYTTEVSRNIWESYPIGRMLAALAMSSVLLSAALLRLCRGAAGEEDLAFPRRLAVMGGHVLAAVLVFTLFAPVAGNKDRYWRELGRSGVYELFSAYRHNQIDYRAFYPVINKTEAFASVKAGLREKGADFLSIAGEDLRRTIHPYQSASAARPNVIVVIMESMGSDFMGDNTPHLRSLAREGLYFSGMKSTGTRTVRGLEAVILSVPPTPGNSIVRRPNNDHLFSMGSLFHAQGYDLTFLYGGYGYFDNMNDFFEGNGYSVTDRADFPRNRRTFATAWGQCDEDLFNVSLDRADAAYASGKPFHQVVLTTSNHRPYTYPEGRIDIPSGTGRRGAVKYADYAIGQFVADASRKPWFRNTVFVFVGDHPAAIAGKSDLPAAKYGVISIIYSPGRIAPREVPTLCSQIDMAPTLFALLGWEYRSQFFGRDILTLPPDQGRAWVSTYQLLGYEDARGLAVLRPGVKAKKNDPLIRDTIASYQCAYDLFVEGGLKEQSVNSGSFAACAAPR